MPLQGGPKNVNTDEERNCDEHEDQNTDSDGNVAEFSFHDRTCEEKTKDGATWEQYITRVELQVGESAERHQQNRPEQTMSADLGQPVRLSCALASASG